VRAPVFTIAPLKSQSLLKKIKLLAYAKPGVGKTSLVGTAADVPQMRDVLVISAEGGELTMLNNPRIAGTEYIDCIQVRTFTQLQSVKDFLFAHCTHRNSGDDEKLRNLQNMVFVGSDAAEPGARLRRFNTVIIDSLTEINDYSMMNILGITQATNLNADVNSAEFKEYKQNHTKMQLLVRQYRDLDMHVLMTAHADWTQDEQKRHHWSLALTGKLSGQVQGFFDIVAFMMAGQATEQAPANRRLFVQPLGPFDAKCRLAGCKKNYFDNPTMADIMKESGLLRTQ
jgi:hypothetical protein